MSLKSNTTPQHYSRRAFLKLAGTSAAAVALAACAAPAGPGAAAPAGGEAGGAAPAQETLTLTLLANGDADLVGFRPAADGYQALNPNVTVETVALPLGEDYYATLQAQIAGGSAPDVASMQGWSHQLFADNNVIVGLNDLRARDNFNYAWADNQVVRDYTERNGDTYLIPMQVATMVMFYVKSAFDEAGLPYPTDDWTFEEFLETAQALTNTSGDQKRWGYQANGNWQRDIHWIRGTGAQEWDTLIDPKASQFNQPEIVDIVQLVANDFYNTLGISPKPADTDSGAGGIESGQSAMKYEGPWWFPRMVTPALRDEGTAVDFDVVLMPRQQDGNQPHRGWAEGVSILSTAPLDAAWELCKYISGEEGQRLFCEPTGRMPNNPDLLESWWGPLVEQNHGLTNWRAFITGFGKGEIDIVSGLPRSQFWLEVIKPVGWDPLIAGSANAADVLPDVDAGVQDLLDDYWASIA